MPAPNTNTEVNAELIANTKVLIDERDGHAKTMREIIEVARAQDKGLTAEQKSKFENANEQFHMAEKVIQANRAMVDAARQELKNQEEAERTSANPALEAVERFCRYGEDPGSEMRGGKLSGSPDGSVFLNAAATTSGGTGANTSAASTIPVTTYDQVIQVLKAYGAAGRYAYHYNSASGEDQNIPNQDTTAEVGAQHGENAPTLSQDSGDTTAGKPVTSAAGGPTPMADFGHTTMKAWTFHSKILSVSREVLQDTAVDIRSLIIGSALRRIGRFINSRMTTTETDSLEGIVSTSKAAVTAPSATTISYDNLISLEHSIPLAYRQGTESIMPSDNPFMPLQGQMAWMMSDGVIQLLRKLKDTRGLPIWIPSVVGFSAADMNMPATILGRPYVVNEHMQAPDTAGNVPLILAHFGYYWVRHIMGIEVVRYDDSNFRSRNAVGFQAWCRDDARWVHPKNASSTVDVSAALTMGS